MVGLFIRSGMGLQIMHAFSMYDRRCDRISCLINPMSGKQYISERSQ